MRLLAAATALVLATATLAASEQVERLMLAMQTSEFMEILSEEGRVQGQTINQAMLDGAGGAYFEMQINDLYDPVWMHMQISKAIEIRMTEEQLEQAAIFFESTLGQIIVSLENSARRALADEATEEMARIAFENADREDAFFRLVVEYVQVNDLIEQNVQGALSSDFSFYRGLANGQGGFSDEEALLEELLSQQEEMKAETIAWLYSFLLMAYRPLDESQMRENITFSRTDAGRALNRALFEGFDELIDNISFQLGAAVAQALRASDL